MAVGVGVLELGLRRRCTDAFMVLILSFDERKKLATLCGIAKVRMP